MSPSHKLLVGGAAALLVFYFAWEWYLSPQARIERFLGRVAEAAEGKDAETLISALSREYSDFRGMDYETVTDLIVRGFEDVDRLNVSLESVRAEVGADVADALFDLIVVAVRGQERYLLVGRPMQPEKIRVRLRKESGGWKILSVTQSEEL